MNTSYLEEYFRSCPTDINTDNDIERLLDLPEDNETQANGNIPKSTASLPKFNNMEGHSRANKLFERNIDAIIPKQFLKTIKRTGLRSTFFLELCFNNDGTERPDSVLNKEPYR